MAQFGYDDTPLIPGSTYKVHDGTRPQPPVVNPDANVSQAVGTSIPADAVILFDGSDLSQWIGKDGEQAQWKVEDGYMEVVPGTGNIKTSEEFGDCQLHIEWRSPSEVKGEGQGRGNSGVFLMGRYEIQVLDSYQNPTYADGSASSVYGEFPPLVNASRQPGEWQTYDILWTAPRFDGEQLVSPAYVTILHNGVVVHNHTELIGPTTHRAVKEYQAHPPQGPLLLQDHGDLVRFRNIWYRPLRDRDLGEAAS